MWGQELFSCGNFAIARIIPTRVGTSRAVRSNSNRQVDHPHACGDKYIKNMTEINPLGSSPRVWGQDIKNIWCSQIVRIIPTRVGTSLLLSQRREGCRDHPHACGDKFKEFIGGSHDAGSSPRVWGQVVDPYYLIKCAGIIPTRVGTSCCCRSRLIRSQDHPLACGDKGLTSDQYVQLWGQE